MADITRQTEPLSDDWTLLSIARSINDINWVLSGEKYKKLSPAQQEISKEKLFRIGHAIQDILETGFIQDVFLLAPDKIGLKGMKQTKGEPIQETLIPCTYKREPDQLESLSPEVFLDKTKDIILTKDRVDLFLRDVDSVLRSAPDDKSIVTLKAKAWDIMAARIDKCYTSENAKLSQAEVLSVSKSVNEIVMTKLEVRSLSPHGNKVYVEEVVEHQLSDIDG